MIQFKINFNKELNTTSSIITDGITINLTEKDLSNLVNSIYNLRSDVFEDIPIIKDSLNTLKNLKEENANLQESLEKFEGW